MAYPTRRGSSAGTGVTTNVGLFRRWARNEVACEEPGGRSGVTPTTETACHVVPVDRNSTAETKERSGPTSVDTKLLNCCTLPPVAFSISKAVSSGSRRLKIDALRRALTCRVWTSNRLRSLWRFNVHAVHEADKVISKPTTTTITVARTGAKVPSRGAMGGRSVALEPSDPLCVATSVIAPPLVSWGSGSLHPGRDGPSCWHPAAVGATYVAVFRGSGRGRLGSMVVSHSCHTCHLDIELRHSVTGPNRRFRAIGRTSPPWPAWPPTKTTTR